MRKQLKELLPDYLIGKWKDYINYKYIDNETINEFPFYQEVVYRVLKEAFENEKFIPDDKIYDIF